MRIGIIALSLGRCKPFLTVPSCGCRGVNRDWARQAASLGHVRNAPLATVGPKKAAGRDGPRPTLLQRKSVMWLFQHVGELSEALRQQDRRSDLAEIRKAGRKKER